MPIRNPFARRPGPVVTQGENQRPGSSAGPGGRADAAHPGFERVDTMGSKASSAFSLRSRKSQDTGEYKMSVVNDSGVYLPPSPIEKEATWPRRYLSPTSSSGASGEIEHFVLSRESFDSYRRSFDICARSPVVAMTDHHHPLPLPGRASLDSHRQQQQRRRLAARFPRPALFDAARGGDPPRQRFAERDEPQPTPGEDDDDGAFEDVGLNDDGTPQPQQGQRQGSSSGQPASRRRGFFAKFGGGGSGGGGGSDGAAAPVEEVGPAMSRFLPGRNRTQGAQGAELAAMASNLDRPVES